MVMHLDPRDIDRAGASLSDETVSKLDVLITPRPVKALIKTTDATSGVQTMDQITGLRISPRMLTRSHLQ